MSKQRKIFQLEEDKNLIPILPDDNFPTSDSPITSYLKEQERLKLLPKINWEEWKEQCGKLTAWLRIFKKCHECNKKCWPADAGMIYVPDNEPQIVYYCKSCIKMNIEFHIMIKFIPEFYLAPLWVEKLKEEIHIT